MSASALSTALAVFTGYALVVALVAGAAGRSLLLSLAASFVIAPLAVTLLSRAAQVTDAVAVVVAFAVPTLQLLAVLLPRRRPAAE